MGQLNTTTTARPAPTDAQLERGIEGPEGLSFWDDSAKCWTTLDGDGRRWFVTAPPANDSPAMRKAHMWHPIFGPQLQRKCATEAWCNAIVAEPLTYRWGGWYGEGVYPLDVPSLVDMDAVEKFVSQLPKDTRPDLCDFLRDRRRARLDAMMYEAAGNDTEYTR